MAAEPDLAPLLAELVDNSDGQEIYLRRPERYGLANSTPTSFEHVSVLGTTALYLVSGQRRQCKVHCFTVS